MSLNSYKIKYLKTWAGGTLTHPLPWAVMRPIVLVQQPFEEETRKAIISGCFCDSINTFLPAYPKKLMPVYNHGAKEPFNIINAHSTLFCDSVQLCQLSVKLAVLLLFLNFHSVTFCWMFCSVFIFADFFFHSRVTGISSTFFRKSSIFLQNF